MGFSYRKQNLGGGNPIIFYFHPETWGRFPFLTNIFQMGWFNHQPKKQTGTFEKKNASHILQFFTSSTTGTTNLRPYPNEEAARYANGGANPPDLSVFWA